MTREFPPRPHGPNSGGSLPPRFNLCSRTVSPRVRRQFYRFEPLEQRVLLSPPRSSSGTSTLAPVDGLTPNEYLSTSRDTATLGSKVFFSAFGYGIEGRNSLSPTPRTDSPTW